MKKMQVTALALGVMAAGLFAFRDMNTGSIKGSVTPAENVVNVWALSSTDTVRSTMENGVFEVSNLKPGDYKLVIEAKLPYSHQIKDSISVMDNQPTDVGTIALMERKFFPRDSVMGQPVQDSLQRQPVKDSTMQQPAKDTTAQKSGQ